MIGICLEFLLLLVQLRSRGSGPSESPLPLSSYIALLVLTQKTDHILEVVGEALGAA